LFLLLSSRSYGMIVVMASKAASACNTIYLLGSCLCFVMNVTWLSWCELGKRKRAIKFHARSSFNTALSTQTWNPNWPSFRLNPFLAKWHKNICNE
jgi:hypothetical protein